MTWIEEKFFLSHGGKISTCFLKLHSTCPKEHFEVKTFFEISFFLSISSELWTNIYRAGRNILGRDIKIENCSLRLKRSIKKSFFWKFSFSTSEFWTNNYRAWQKSFRQGYRNWKLQSSSHNINEKIKLLELLFFSNSSELWTNFYRAWRQTFRQGFQNWKLQSSSRKIKQKIKYLKNLFFFQKFSELWTNIYRAWRKSFWQGYQNCKLYSKSSEYHVADKNNFWNFCKFSFYSDLEQNFWVCGNRVFTRVVKKAF